MMDITGPAKIMASEEFMELYDEADKAMKTLKMAAEAMNKMGLNVELEFTYFNDSLKKWRVCGREER